MADLRALAEDWLAAKAATPRRGDRDGHSSRARVADLCRWGRALQVATGRRDTEAPFAGALDLDVDLAGLGTEDLDTRVLRQALAVIAGHYAPSSRARMLSTMRGLCRYATREGLLAADPTDDEFVAAPVPARRLPRSLEPADLDAVLAAAHAPPPRSRARWPVRDVALLGCAAHCGLRAGELAAARVGWVRLAADPPVLTVLEAKGDTPRVVPVTRAVAGPLVTYLAVHPDPTPAAPLFCRPDGTELSTKALDRLVRSCATQAGVALPPGAALHALRHSYGTELARRGVPVNVISELLGHADLRSTSVYTRVRAAEAAAALDDAGLL